MINKMSISHNAERLNIDIAYKRPYLLGLAIVVSLLFGTDCISAASETDRSSVTIGDPVVDVEELELMLKPLTRDELLVEASAW